MQLTDSEIERADELAETWVNGNHKDVRDALAELDPLPAAALAVRIFQILADLIEYDHSNAAGFAQRLATWAE